MKSPASLFSLAALAGLAALLWPADAFAFGPLAHLQFSSAALDSLSLFTAGTRSLLVNHSGEFLYGSVAADIVVGKNLAKYAVHCHNWLIGFRVLERARNDAQKAFSLGFLGHLACDTVAHNYYVPYKTVQAFRRRGSGHAYWELRFDQRQSADLWKLAREVTKAEYRAHDLHLQEVLSESQVLPFSISRRLFGSYLRAACLENWQRVSGVVAGERDLSLHAEEIRECQKLAVAHLVEAIRRGPEAECVQADPTGARNLQLARQLRSRLRDRKDLTEKQADEVVRSARPAFRRAILGRLELPEVPEAARTRSALR
ncbi:MAG: zinc dependent phospholipase C family protein [Myxococcales bacterium]|nr:zinc dependent phospholipase C family protein [Myxococcales bacterium]